MDNKILLHVCFDPLWVRFWLGIVPNAAVDMLLGSSIIGGFIRGIFPSERKFVPSSSYPVPILCSFKIFKSSNPTTSVVNTPIGDTHKTDIEFNEMPVPAHRHCMPCLNLIPSVVCGYRIKNWYSHHGVYDNIANSSTDICSPWLEWRSTVATILYSRFHLSCKSDEYTQKYVGSVCHQNSGVFYECFLHSQWAATIWSPESMHHSALSDNIPLASRRDKVLH